MGQFRKNGILPEALVNYLALLGWANPEGKEVLSAAELTGLFNLKKVSRSAAVFDYDKLHWLNRQHVRSMSARDRAVLAKSFLSREGLVPERETAELAAWLQDTAELLMDGLDRFADLPDKFREVFAFSPSEMDQETLALLKDPCAEKVLAALDGRLKMDPDLNYQRLGELSKEIKQETGCKGPQLFRPLRVAFTAKASAPGMSECLASQFSSLTAMPSFFGMPPTPGGRSSTRLLSTIANCPSRKKASRGSVAIQFGLPRPAFR